MIYGESGTGKDTVVNHLCECTNLTRVKSFTTRPKRKDTKDKLSHMFVSEQTFNALLNKVAYSEYNGYKYCATAKQIDNNDLYIIDSEGIETLRQKYKGRKKIKIIQIYTSQEERIKRMRKRGDNIDNTNERIEYDKTAFDNKVIPDFRVENKDVGLCAIEIYNYIKEQERIAMIDNPKIKVPKYEKVIYISHKFGGDMDNIKDIERIVKNLQKENPTYLFISPCHSFGYLYDDVSYEDGLNYTLWMLNKCDEIWITGSEWRSSIGVNKEIEFAKQYNIPICMKDFV